MLIAQLSVAGEEHPRLNTSSTDIAGEDQQALEEFACDRSNLPWIIFRAAHRANHITALPARARSLLAALARTVDAARPFAAIFARRELLTGRAMQSMRTFYRGLEDLEGAGMITRPPQMRYGGAGLFGRAYLHLTPKAAILLGLVQPAEQDEHQTENCQPEDDTLANAPLQFAPPSVTVADGAIYKDLNPITQKRQPGTLPRDLERLRTLGFRDFLIFKLMAEARQNAKRLSDVVEATWEHLRHAKRPINYLRALLRSPVDFAYRVRSAHEQKTAEKVQQVQEAQAESAAHNLAGCQFESSDGSKLFFVSDDASSVTVRHRDHATTRVRAGKWIHDFRSALDSGAIRPTTPERPITPARVDEPDRARRTLFASRLAELKLLLKQQQATAISRLSDAHAPHGATSAIDASADRQTPAFRHILPHRE